MPKRIIMADEQGEPDKTTSGPLRRLDRWAASLGERLSKSIDRARHNYGNIFRLLWFLAVLSIPIVFAITAAFSLFGKNGDARGSKQADIPVTALSNKEIEALKEQQRILTEKAGQIETRLSTLSAADVSDRLAQFESEIAALDTYVEELFAPKKGKDVLIVKSIVDDLRQLREKSASLQSQIESLGEDRIRVETKIDNVQADQRTLLHWVLSLGAFLFLGLLVAVRYLGKKLEPLLLRPTESKSESAPSTEADSG